MKVGKSSKKIVKEPFEVLKTAKRQVIGTEKLAQPEPSRKEGVEGGTGETSSLEEEKMKVKSKRLLEALETEIEEIRKQKELKEEEKLKEEEEKSKPLVEPLPRRPRKVLGGMKGKLQKLKRRAEIRMPPSG